MTLLFHQTFLLQLLRNNLQGQLPRELINCRRLEYFDISHNSINDTFPFWLGDLPELKVFGLSKNEFHGEIRCYGNMTCTFPKLHIIDLSHNEFSGSFSSEMIQSWKTMKTSNTSQLQYEQWLIYFRSSKNKGIWPEANAYSFTISNK
jgi:Ran GTPase-activating protein (RanGAP) involved in mRNA processing and transport